MQSWCGSLCWLKLSSCCLDVHAVNICNCSIYLPPPPQPSPLICPHSQSSRAFFIQFLGRETETVLERGKEISMLDVRMSSLGLFLFPSNSLLFFFSFAHSFSPPDGMFLCLPATAGWLKCLEAPPLDLLFFFIFASFCWELPSNEHLQKKQKTYLNLSNNNICVSPFYPVLHSSGC